MVAGLSFVSLASDCSTVIEGFTMLLVSSANFSWFKTTCSAGSGGPLFETGRSRDFVFLAGDPNTALSGFESICWHWPMIIRIFCFYSATILIIIEGVKFDLIVCLHVIWLKIIGSRNFCSKSFSSRDKEIVDRWSNSLQFSRGDLDKIINYSETHDKNFIRFAQRSPGMQKIQNFWKTLDQLLVERIWWEV